MKRSRKHLIDLQEQNIWLRHVLTPLRFECVGSYAVAS